MVSPRPYVYINIHKLSLNSFIPLICEILPIRLIRKRVSEFIFFFFSFTIFFSNCSNLRKRFYRIRKIIFFFRYYSRIVPRILHKIEFSPAPFVRIRIFGRLGDIHQAIPVLGKFNRRWTTNISNLYTFRSNSFKTRAAQVLYCCCTALCSPEACPSKRNASFHPLSLE